MINPAIKFITIVGPTASGKTALSLQIAKKYSGEIICADSRTVYQGLDIATAKPTAAQRYAVPHHLLDLTTPDQPINVAQFKKLAEKTIESIAAHKKLPLLVGGSGLYVDSVLFDYQFPSAPDPDIHEALSKLSLTELIARLRPMAPSSLATIDLSNRRRVLRAVETLGHTPTKRPTSLPQTLVLGLGRTMSRRNDIIASRIRQMIAEGLIDEVRHVANRYGWEVEALTGIGYRALRSYLAGDATLGDAIMAFEYGDRHLAKRQLTWFRRNPAIVWLDEPSDAFPLIEAFLYDQAASAPSSV